MKKMLFVLLLAAFAATAAFAVEGHPAGKVRHENGNRHLRSRRPPDKGCRLQNLPPQRG